MIRTLETVAYAKLNLTLHVVGKRADGLHLLDSLTVFTQFGDHVRISTGHGNDRVDVSGPFAGAIDGENIVSKALFLYRGLTDTPDGLVIEIVKNIPVAAGLGGGSCDVGAVLRLLQKIVDQPLSAEALNTLATSVGADVPVCLSAQPARMKGIGELLSFIDPIPAHQIVLVNPSVGLSAGKVFQAFRGPFSGPVGVPGGFSDGEELFAHIGAEPRNDLLGTATRLAPVISDVLTYLRGVPRARSVGMSGSGPTCFAVFSNGDGEALKSALEGAREKGWWATATAARA